MPQCERCVRADIHCIPLPNHTVCAHCRRIKQGCSLVGAKSRSLRSTHAPAAEDVVDGESQTEPDRDEGQESGADDSVTDYSNVDVTLRSPAPDENPRYAIWAALRRLDQKLDTLGERFDELFHHHTTPAQLRPRARAAKRRAARDRSPLRVLKRRRKGLTGHEQLPNDQRIAEWRARGRTEPSVEAGIPIAGPSDLERSARVGRERKAPAGDRAAVAKLQKYLNDEDRELHDEEDEDEDDEQAPNTIVAGSVEGEESFHPRGKRPVW